MSEKPWEVPLSNEEQADLFGQMGKWLKNGGMTSKSFVPSEMQNMFRMVATIVLLRAQHAAQAAEIERLKGERQMSAGFDPASDNGDESAVILMCFNCAYAGPRGEDDEGNVCCPECGARAMEASNG